MKPEPVPERAKPAATAGRWFDYRFTLWHLLYAIAMMAASLAVFGTGGFVLGLFIVAFWAFVYTSKSRVNALRIALAAVLCLLFFGCCLTTSAPHQAVEIRTVGSHQHNQRNTADIYRLAIFIALVHLPLPGVWLSRVNG